MRAGQSPAIGTATPSRSLECALGVNGDLEGPELVGAIRLNLDREIAEVVQAHELRQRGGAIRGAAKLPRHGRCVHRVIEVRMPDEDAHRLSLRGGGTAGVL